MPTSDPSQLFPARFSAASAPGIRSKTTYVVPGLAVSYTSPDVLYGFSGEGRASYEAYEALDGGKFTFDRVEARMALHYGIEDQPWSQASFPYLRSLLGSSRFTADANLVISEPRSRNGGSVLSPADIGRRRHPQRKLAQELHELPVPSAEHGGVRRHLRTATDRPGRLLRLRAMGKGGGNAGDLDFDHLKYSVGGGLTLRLGGQALLEFSSAWGGDEGYQTYVTGNTNNAIGFGARAAGSVGLRGVF